MHLCRKTTHNLTSCSSPWAVSTSIIILLILWHTLLVTYNVMSINNLFTYQRYHKKPHQKNMYEIPLSWYFFFMQQHKSKLSSCKIQHLHNIIPRPIYIHVVKISKSIIIITLWIWMLYIAIAIPYYSNYIHVIAREIAW